MDDNNKDKNNKAQASTSRGRPRLNLSQCEKKKGLLLYFTSTMWMDDIDTYFTESKVVVISHCFPT